MAKRGGGSGGVTIMLTRESVCLADDVDAPHPHPLTIEAQADLLAIAVRIAASSYLPMQGDEWGWVIEAKDVVIAIRPRRLWGRWTVVLQGDPTTVRATDLTTLSASYVRADSQWFSYGPRPPRVAGWMIICGVGGLALLLGAMQLLH